MAALYGRHPSPRSLSCGQTDTQTHTYELCSAYIQKRTGKSKLKLELYSLKNSSPTLDRVQCTANHQTWSKKRMSQHVLQRLLTIRLL